MADVKNPLAGRVMGIGTWAWGSKKLWGYQASGSNFNESTAADAFRRSIELGVTLVDTAPIYGKGESERLVGKFLKTLDPKLQNNTVVATKYNPMPWHFNCRTQLLKSVKESLQRLGLEKVGLLQIHGPALSVRSIEHLSDALADAYDAGLCTAVGVSNFSSDEVRRAHAALAKRNIPLTSNQIEYSLLRTSPETNGLVSTCNQLGVSILAYSPLAMGRLTGKYSAANPPPGGRFFGDVPMEKVDPLLTKMKDIGGREGKTVAQVALNWCICKGAIPIPGAKNAKQAEDNAGALGWKLNPRDMDELDALGLPGKTSFFWQHG